MYSSPRAFHVSHVIQFSWVKSSKKPFTQYIVWAIPMDHLTNGPSWMSHQFPMALALTLGKYTTKTVYGTTQPTKIPAFMSLPGARGDPQRALMYRATKAQPCHATQLGYFAQQLLTHQLDALQYDYRCKKYYSTELWGLYHKTLYGHNKICNLVKPLLLSVTFYWFCQTHQLTMQSGGWQHKLS